MPRPMELGDNVQATLHENGILQITIDTKKAGVRSASGKSSVIASTRGNTPVLNESNQVLGQLGLNFYRKS